jgi:hypothetical protein
MDVTLHKFDSGGANEYYRRQRDINKSGQTTRYGNLFRHIIWHHCANVDSVVTLAVGPRLLILTSNKLF